ncbi:MAG: GNAT family N-acetyltransferase [Anaerolineae bacterium]|nr:GNAT family N-acetyltransferase [Anaerolineae bacterium]
MDRDSYQVCIEAAPNPEDIHRLRTNLAAHNIARMDGDDHYEEQLISLRNAAGELVGGAVVSFFWGMAEINFLWVHESLRGRGYGRDLLAAAEQEAVRHHCHYAFLDTFSFQAPGFYERLGYQIVAEIKDYPPGQSKYFLKKALPTGETP